MIARWLLVGSLSVFTVPARAQDPILAPGASIRLVAAAFGVDPVVTRVVRLAGDSLILQTDPRLPELAIARSDITRLEVAAGRANSRDRLMGLGLGTGFGVGVILGLTIGGYVTNPDLAKPSSETGRALIGGVIGAGAGLLFGAVVGSAHRETSWRVVDHQAVRMALRPIIGSSVGVAIALRFGNR